MVQGAPLKCCLAERWNVSTLWSCYRRYTSPGLCSKDKGAVALCGSLYCHPITSFLTWKGNCWIQFVHTYISTSFVFLLPNCLLWLEIMEFYSRRLQLESDLFLFFMQENIGTTQDVTFSVLRGLIARACFFLIEACSQTRRVPLSWW